MASEAQLRQQEAAALAQAHQEMLKHNYLKRVEAARNAADKRSPITAMDKVRLALGSADEQPQ